MSAQEIDLTLTPHQATYGVILTLDLPTGPARVRVPSCRDGELVRTRVGDREVPLRIRVAQPGPAAAPAPPPPSPAPTATLASPPILTPPPPSPAPKRGAAGCLVGLGLVVAVIIGAVLIGSGDETDSKASGSSTPTTAGSPLDDSSTPSSYPSAAPADPEPEPAPPTPTAAAPTPLDKGTCLNGTLPDSTTAQRVDDVEEVSCSASDAHYRVIESIPMTSDMSRCDDNPKTEYAFSHRYTLNGAVINEYVYCLVGIGSYAR